jgi:hypothetical protein
MSSLVDHGANGRVAGGDVRIIKLTSCLVDVKGINNHQVIDTPVVTCGAVLITHCGPMIRIMHQYAQFGTG